ncbi:MAG: PEP-CTERM sorting domain-containing protein [Chromatiales bacterium]
MTTGPAFAGTHAFVQVPEPGSLSLLAMGAAGAAVVYRLRRKK